ncbi:hypothetical protein F7725_023374 [Dissostichus mawsoni]|uniref:Uncharacterized protein n=1 Tax=Dissostichus mawsoni TaxID=36200 RepID=A0A7J5Z2N3_DISMA|nr:hypothetical protein F7725_023374 [Dissostichus mawsoni]
MLDLVGLGSGAVCGKLTVSSFSDSQFESYEVRIQDKRVFLGSGSLVSVPILFEETFYNQQEQSYSILVLSRPPAAPFCLRSLEDVREFLGRHAQKLDKLIQNFCQNFREQERKGCGTTSYDKMASSSSYLLFPFYVFILIQEFHT